jgi:hypothetical protein
MMATVTNLSMTGPYRVARIAALLVLSPSIARADDSPCTVAMRVDWSSVTVRRQLPIDDRAWQLIAGIEIEPWTLIQVPRAWRHRNDPPPQPGSRDEAIDSVPGFVDTRRMTQLTSLAWIALGAALAACGGGGDGAATDGSKFVATYAVTSHTEARGLGTSIACTIAGTPVASAKPYVKIQVDPFLMEPDFLTMVECRDAAASDCVDTLVSLRPGGVGLEDESANTQTGGGVMCQLYYSHFQATLDGATVHVELLDKFAAPNLSSSDCTLARAQALADSPDCQHVERWDGTRL